MSCCFCRQACNLESQSCSVVTNLMRCLHHCMNNDYSGHVLRLCHSLFCCLFCCNICRRDAGITKTNNKQLHCKQRKELKLFLWASRTGFTYEYMTVHEETRCKLEIEILDNAHLKVQTLCYFMLKSDWPNGDKITSV